MDIENEKHQPYHNEYVNEKGEVTNEKLELSHQS